MATGWYEKDGNVLSLETRTTEPTRITSGWLERPGNADEDDNVVASTLILTVMDDVRILVMTRLVLVPAREY